MIRRFILILLAFAGWLPPSVIGQTLRDGSLTHRPVYFNHDGMWKTAMPTVKTDSTGCPCDSDWSPIHQLTTNDSYFLRIASQGDNIVHSIWKENNHRLLYARSIDGANTFEPTRELLPDSVFTNYASDPDIVGNENIVYIFFVNPTSVSYSAIWMMRSLDSGVHWENPKNITVNKDSSTDLRCPSISGDTIGIIYRSKKLKGKLSIIYSTNKGETWKQTRTKLPTGDEYRIALTPGYTHLIYVKYGKKSYAGGEVMYRNSKNFGKSWGKEFAVTKPDSHSSFSPSISASRNGSVYVVWLDGKHGSMNGFGLSAMERHTLNNGKSWSSEIALTTQPEAQWAYSPYHRVVDSEEKNAAVLGITWDTDAALFSNVYRVKTKMYISGNSGWCPEFLVTPDANYAGSSTITITPKRVVIGWSERIQKSQSIFCQYVRSARLQSRKIARNISSKENGFSPFQLEQNYPNPFNPKTVIRYSLPVNSIVTLKVYNVLGQVVAKLLENEDKHYGAQEVEFNAANLASGVYYYRLDVLTEDGESFSETKKLVVMK